jgi:hypothetical protein
VPLDEPLHVHAEAQQEHAAAVVVEPAQPETSGVESSPVIDPWAPAEAQPATPEESGFEPLETPEG